MPKFITLNERVLRPAALAAGAETPMIKVIDGVLHYFSDGQWVPVESEETTNVTNVTNVSMGAEVDVLRSIYFAGLGYSIHG
jgi:hypothetical protein